MEHKLLAQLTISFVLLYWVCHPLPQAVRLQHRESRTQRPKSHQKLGLIQQFRRTKTGRIQAVSWNRSETRPDKTWSDATALGNRSGTESDNMERDDQSQDVPEWLQNFTENLEDPEISVHAHISRQDSDSERPTKVVAKKKRKRSLKKSLPKRPELRRVLEDPNYEVSLRKTHLRSIYSTSRKVWWLDNSGSQSPQRGRWISEQSPIRCRGTRSCYSMDSVLSV